MGKIIIKLFLLFFSFISFSCFAAQSYSIDDSMANIIMFFKATIGVLWNAKAVLGILILISSCTIYYVSNKKNDGGVPIIYLFLMVGVSGLLITTGVSDLTSEMLGIKNNQFESESSSIKDGRANLSKLTKYEFIKGKQTQK